MPTRNAAVSSDTVAGRNRMLLETGKHSDFIVRCKDRDFKVHKFILQNAGSYFEGALNGSFQEAITGVIDMGDCDAEMVHAMLQYIYHDDYVTQECNTIAMVDRLCFHAKVDQLAKRMMLDGLEKRAADHFEYDLKGDHNPEDLENALCHIARYVYSDVAASSNEFRTVVSKAVALRAFSMAGAEWIPSKWISALEDTNPLATDMLRHAADANNTAWPSVSHEAIRSFCSRCEQDMWTLAEPTFPCPLCQIDGVSFPLELMNERAIIHRKFND